MSKEFLEKVLSIIKEKNVDIRALRNTNTNREYNFRILELNPTITSSVDFLYQEEFDLLKRWLV